MFKINNKDTSLTSFFFISVFFLLLNLVVCILILMLHFFFSRQSYAILYAIVWKKNRRKELKMISVRTITIPSKKNCVICFIENSLKMMKNAFYFILKALFVLKIFKFLSWLFGHVEKKTWLERTGLFQNSWFPWLTNNCIHILPNISGNKSHQAMKLGQLIDSNKRNIFLQKLYRKWGRETSSRPLYFLNMLNLR